MLYAFAWKSIVPYVRRRLRRVEGLENVPATGAYILAANHVSWLDPLYLSAALGRERGWRIHFISKTRKHRWAHTLPIDSENQSGVLPAAIAALLRGEAVAIFPEGFSNPEPVMPRGKTGVARLALATGAPIVPAAIHGRPAPNWWRSVLGFLFPINVVRAVLQKRTFDVTFGTPILVVRRGDLPREEVRRLTDEVMRRIAHLSGKQYVPA